MSGIKISNLPAIASSLLTDVFPAVQAGVTYKTTLQQAYNLFSATSGIVNSGLINQLARYSANGNTISGLATANSSVLVTSAGGVPSLGTALPSGLTATNMNLTTPTLGVASATSINFGGGALANYIPKTSFTPTFTCVTPGDLSVSYAVQIGSYIRIGGLVFIQIYITCTPTFTTASGSLLISGLPITSTTTFCNFTLEQLSSGFTWPTGTTQATPTTGASSSSLSIAAFGSTRTPSLFATTNIVSGAAITIILSGFYYV